MNILDEDIGRSQRQRLAAWKIHLRQIGDEIGRSGLKDREGIIPLLHQLKRPPLLHAGSRLLSSYVAASGILPCLS